MTSAPASKGFYRLDADWRMVAIDDIAQDHLRRSADEVLGRTLWDVAPGLIGTACERHYRRAMERREACEFVGPSTIQPGRWLEVRLTPTEGGLTAWLSDVTDRIERPLATSRA